MSRWDRPELTAVIEAIQVLVDARRECDAAHEAYTGWSWGYVGGHLITAVDDATDTLAEKLNAYIDSRIEERLKNDRV